MTLTRRLCVSGIVSILAMLLLISSASAGRVWCAIDPVVRLNGSTVQILVAVPDDAVARVNGPVAVEIRAPVGTAREVISTDAGFNGYGETVAFSDFPAWVQVYGATLAQITVSVPLTAGGPPSVPVQVTIIHGDNTLVVQGSSIGTTVFTLVPNTN